LHRDLSENNLMFKPGTTKGILNDWDMASYLEDDDEIKLSTATHRTGTVPFMARDLLTDDTPPPHLYRHDLESFFYILVWAALHYDFPRKEKLKRIAKVQGWDAVSFETARTAKEGFISHSGTKNGLFLLVRPENAALLPWMTSLWTLFRDSHFEYEKENASPDFDNKTINGHLTFETFMQALGRKPR
jgi:serine/threonine protein kinase